MEAQVTTRKKLRLMTPEELLAAKRDRDRRKHAECRGYRNTATAPNHSHPRKAMNIADPPAIVECSSCNERVIAKDRRYWEVTDLGPFLVDHRHQPAGAGHFKLFVD